MRKLVIIVQFLILGLIGIGTTVVTPVQAVEIPPSLEPWKAWVLHDHEDISCPAHFDDPALRRCWWPSRLFITVDDQGGQFEERVTVYAPSWVELPGDTSHWPESVIIGGAGVPVVDRNKRPHIRLVPGAYRVKGTFVWDTLPENLNIPASVGIVVLTVNGRDIREPDLEPGGRLRLHGKGATVGREDTLSVTLFRLIEDDIPMRVTTRIMLDVSGRAREIRLEALLPDGGKVMKVDSPLPTRLTRSGDLLVQARPGPWDIRVTVRLDGPVKTLSAGKGRYGEETWSFKAFNHLRMVKVVGAPTLEPSRTRMPDEWKGYPAYLIKPGSALSFEVVRRGDPDPAPNQLDLVRTWWLDFNGGGFTIHDRITGTLSRTWHLAMHAPLQLGRVAVDGNDQLITLQGDPPAPGAQLRRGRLVLEADSRLDRTAATLPAVGWDHDFRRVRGVLHLPPGWTLFSAEGIDVPPGDWLQRWTLLDLFLVLIIAISAFNIRNRTTGGLALATLVLIYHEPGAPRLVWLHLLAVAALLNYLPHGRFKTVIKLWGAGAVIALIVIAVPFMVQQVRQAIYPQLMPGGYGIQPRVSAPDMGMLAAPQMDAAIEPAPIRKKVRKTDDAAPLSLSEPTVLQARVSADPDALIQTGPGLPAWQWQRVQLNWSGPVDRAQTIRLWLISPVMNMVLGLVRVLLLLMLIVALLDLAHWRRYLSTPVTTATSALMLMLVVLTSAQHLQAAGPEYAFPPEPLLEELRQRLLEPSPCFPRCADVSRLALSATPEQLRLVMQIHAQVDTAIPLPATLETWRPNRILTDNRAVRQLARDDRGTLWMVLPQGVHQVELTGSTGLADEIRIAFPIVPHQGTFVGMGWQARGFTPDGRMDGTISLLRDKSHRQGETEMTNAEIPAFFQVTRTLHLGIRWEVVTRIQRLTAPGKPAVLSIPLLENASVITAGIQAKNGVAQVPFRPQDLENQFSTTIPIAPTIRLTAGQADSWSETWILDAAPMWRCDVSGLTVVHHQDAGRNWQPQWRPWPGEQVTITVTRPEAVPGRTITVDSARLTLTPGERIFRGALTLNIRTSKGGQQPIQLPEPADLQSVNLNGRSLPIRQDGRQVTVPLEPGNQMVKLEWHQLSDSMLRIRGPHIHIGEAAVNAAVSFRMPANRWILFAGGPRLGPAVLFWSYLIVVGLVAVGLGRTTLTPLTTLDWLLLGLGLTQVPAAVAMIVVGWLLALGYRCRKTAPEPLAFNSGQILLLILTAAALVALYTAIERGLLGIPDMQIAGNQSTRLQLNWSQDRIDGTIPSPWVVSLPQWIYHLLMLAWSLWLALRLIAWLRWGWGCFTNEGLWKPLRWRRKDKKGEARNQANVRVSTPSPDSLEHL